jgi:hypothetical protein
MAKDQKSPTDNVRCRDRVFLYSLYFLNPFIDFLSTYHFTPLQWTFSIIAALCLGVSKTGFTGISLLGVALMAEIWPARESTGVILPMLIFADFFAVFFFRNMHSGAKSGGYFHQLWSAYSSDSSVSGSYRPRRLLPLLGG